MSASVSAFQLNSSELVMCSISFTHFYHVTSKSDSFMNSIKILSGISDLTYK